MSVVKRPTATSKWYLPGIFVGLGITIKHMLFNLTHRKDIYTIEYPEERYPYSDRFKGNHILTVKKDGSLRCTACMLCATYCPAECISITAAEHDDPNVEKYPIAYEIDILRCIFCGFCEEACPVDAIRMGPEHQTAAIVGDKFVYDINKLAYRPTLKGGVLSKVDDEERHKKGIMSWLTTRYETIVRHLENKLHFPWVMATGCCVHEIENAGLATYDWQRLGVDNIANDPTQSNLLFIAGWINPLRAEEIKKIYSQMRKPTSVIAVGACALTGSPYNTFENSTHVIRASDLVPVDVSLVGCPPRPEAILAAILELQRKLSPGPSAKEVLYEALK